MNIEEKIKSFNDRQLLELILTNQIVIERKLERMDIFLQELFNNKIHNIDFTSSNENGEKRQYLTIGNYRDDGKNFEDLLEENISIKNTNL